MGCLHTKSKASLTTTKEKSNRENCEHNIEQNWEDKLSKDFQAPVTTIYQEPNGENWDLDSKENWEDKLSDNFQAPLNNTQEEPYGENWDLETTEQWNPETAWKWDPNTEENWEPKSEEEQIAEENWEPNSEETWEPNSEETWEPNSEETWDTDFITEERWDINTTDIQPTSTTHVLTPDSFTFHRILGEGTYGKVMLASHPSIGEHLAVKMVKKRVLIEEDPSCVQIERQMLEMCRDSRFFTKAFAAFQTEDYIFFVMEYLSGGELSSLIEAKAPFDVATTRFFAAEMLCGLQDLHSRGIVHRDIKPDNVLLDSAGHAKIADFGLAEAGMFGSRTVTDGVGTPPYMAPEVHRCEPYNKIADYFSLGCIIYEMAVGSQPFPDSEDYETVCTRVCTDTPVYPEHMDPELRDLIERLLSKDQRIREQLIGNLRDHPFFSTVDWADLEAGKTPPPFEMKPVPVIKTNDFISVADLMKSSEALKPPIPAEEQMYFKGFSFMIER